MMDDPSDDVPAAYRGEFAVVAMTGENAFGIACRTDQADGIAAKAREKFGAEANVIIVKGISVDAIRRLSGLFERGVEGNTRAAILALLNEGTN